MTPREHQVFSFIKSYIAEHGYSPSVKEIMLGIGYRSRGSVHHYVESLVARGLLKREPGRRRGLSLPEIPLLGRIAAGRPIEAVPENERIDFYDRLGVPGLYQLVVAGDSMIEAGIYDGDTVLIQPAESAPDGAIVVALVDGGEATLKRIYQRPGRITLKAENPDYPPQHYAPERVQIQGRLYCVARFYR